MGTDEKLVYPQKSATVGLVRKGATSIEQQLAPFNVIAWRSSTNRGVVESSCVAETHAALMGSGVGHFAQVLMAEIRFGSEVISAVDDDGWQDLVPLTMVSGCKSIYDTSPPNGQHVADKGSIVRAVLLRQFREGRIVAGY